MKIEILTNGVGFGGRGKALLSLSDYLSENFDVVVVSSSLRQVNSVQELIDHHGIEPGVEWVSFDEDLSEDSPFLLEDSDLAVGFDSTANSLLHHFDVPTVAYCRRGIGDWADEYWTPSRMAADRHNAWLREHELEDNCHPIYPIWYIQKPDSVKPFDEREYDVLIHDRKAEEVGEYLEDYRVHYASDYSWDELTDVYENSKVFLFPSKTRFEPLGLMPIEAANFGCHLSLPRNAGVSEIFPESVYRRPEKAISDLLDEDDVLDVSLPTSPTDPHKRVLSMVSGQVTV